MTATSESPVRTAVRRDRPNWTGWAFVGPFMAVFALVLVAPVAYSIYLSLFREQLIGGTSFVGLENYAQALADPKFWDALGRVVALPRRAGAHHARHRPRSSRSRSTAAGSTASLVLPHLDLPALRGARRRRDAHVGLHVRHTLRADRQHQRRASASSCPTRSPPSWILASIGNIVTWEFVGYNMLIFYAALRVIPTDLYEAAALDGAGAVPHRPRTSRSPPSAARS